MNKHKLNELAQPTGNQLHANDTIAEAANEHKRLDLQLRAVCECDYCIVHAIDEKVLLSDICRILCVIAKYKLAWVGTVLNAENKSLCPLVWYSADDQVLSQNWTSAENWQGPINIVIRTGKTQFFKDVAIAPAMSPWRDAVLEQGYRSCISLPLSKNGNICYVLSLYSSIPNSFSPHEVRLLETMVGNIEYAINAINENRQRQLAESEIAHLATLAEFNPNEILEFDNDGNVKYANPAARTHFPLMVQGLKKELVMEYINLVRKTEEHSISRDINIGNYWFEQTVTYISFTQSYLLYGRDITVRKQYEEKLQQKTIQLESINTELEAFSYSVSHDLKAPLRSLSGFSAALSEDYGENLDENGKLYLRKLKESSDQMAQLIDNLLKLARISLSNMVLESVNLSDMAEQIVDELQCSQPNRRVIVTIQPNLTVKGDKILLSRVIENLLSNAWKFSSKVPQPQIEVGITERDGNQAYFIRDNGAGFNMDYASKLFKPFQRLHTVSDFPGTGIGLAIVQRIIHRHGGEVWAEGKVGEGATFYFTLG